MLNKRPGEMKQANNSYEKSKGMDMKIIKVIIASVRDKRNGGKIYSWLSGELKKYSGNLEFEAVDLRELNLPSMNEPAHPKSGEKYKYEHTRNWSSIVKDADGFIIITPEYNHGYPGSLKNALDYLYYEWVGKPVGLVGYGGSGARYARMHLKDVFNVIGLIPMEEEIAISSIWEAFDDEDKLKTDLIKGNIQRQLKQLDDFLHKSE